LLIIYLMNSLGLIFAVIFLGDHISNNVNYNFF